MLLIVNYYKKIITNAGKIYPLDSVNRLVAALLNKAVIPALKPGSSHNNLKSVRYRQKQFNNYRYSILKQRQSQKNKGFTLLELLIIIVILTIAITYTSPVTSLQKIYYQHRTKIIANKITNLVNFAKRAAVISNQDITLCPFDHIIQKCTTNWHNPIIIFYSNNKNNFLKPLLKENHLISNQEKITISSFNKKNSIVFKKNNNDSANMTITYSNLYYTENIIINRTGRAK